MDRAIVLGIFGGRYIRTNPSLRIEVIMKNKKVLNLRTHLGGLLAKQSYDSVKDKADMEVLAVGILIKTLKGKEVNMLIPYSNVVEARLEGESSKDE